MLREKGDLKSNILADGSDDEEAPDNSGICAGFSKIEDKIACNNDADGLLWIETTKGKKNFCKPTHMLRCIGKYHLGQGKKAISETSKKRKADENKEEESTEPSESSKTTRKTK